MSYLDPSQDPTLNEDENQSQVDKAQNQSNQNPSSSGTQDVAPSTGGGGAGIVTGGGVGNTLTPAASAPKPSSSGSWTNLDSYLKANADQGSTVGNAIAGTVNAQGTTAQRDIDQFNTDFGNQVNSNVVDQDQSAVNDAINAAKTSGTLSQDQINNFQKQAKANYSGPTDPTTDQYYSQTQNDVNNAAQSAAQTQSEAGRDVLLQNQYQNTSNNGYNQGENNLDQMLLENSPGGQQSLQPLYGQWSGLSGALSSSVTNNQQAAQAAQATDQATAQNAQNALNTANTDFNNTLNNEVQNATTQGQADYSDYQANLANNNYSLDAQTLAAMGIQPGTRTFNLDLQSYLNPFSPGNISAQTVATPQEYAEYQALNQLAGTQPSELINSSLAGTAPKAGFNTTQLQSDLTAKQNTYNDLFNNQGQSIRSFIPGGYTMDTINNMYQLGLPNGAWNFELTPSQMQNYVQTLSPNSYWYPIISNALNKFNTDQGWNNVVNAVNK